LWIVRTMSVWTKIPESSYPSRACVSHMWDVYEDPFFNRFISDSHLYGELVEDTHVCTYIIRCIFYNKFLLYYVHIFSRWRPTAYKKHVRAVGNVTDLCISVENMAKTGGWMQTFLSTPLTQKVGFPLLFITHKSETMHNYLCMYVDRCNLCWIAY
jgi:hypothetical protein